MLVGACQRQLHALVQAAGFKRDSGSLLHENRWIAAIVRVAELKG
jgi:hypothetical protein